MLLKLIITSAIIYISSVKSEFTFRNVIITCDNDDESPFATIVTTNRLKPHLPGDQKCYKIAVQYSAIPVLYNESLSEINNVNFLLLENDSIEELEPGAFRDLKVKEALSLRSNKIREIRRGVFNGVHIPILFLSYNFISYIDYQAFDNMTVLESVHLDHNKLTRIDIFWFQNTPKLNKINFQYNLIEQVPSQAFQNLGDKKIGAASIDLSHNSIRFVDRNALVGIKKLHFLSLAYNRIDTLPKDWIKGVKVNSLDVTNNRLNCLLNGLAEPYSTNYIDKNFWGCACLEEMKKKECTSFGKIVAQESLKRCNIFPEQNNC